MNRHQIRLAALSFCIIAALAIWLWPESSSKKTSNSKIKNYPSNETVAPLPINFKSLGLAYASSHDQAINYLNTIDKSKRLREVQSLIAEVLKENSPEKCTLLVEFLDKIESCLGQDYEIALAGRLDLLGVILSLNNIIALSNEVDSRVLATKLSYLVGAHASINDLGQIDSLNKHQRGIALLTLGGKLKSVPELNHYLAANGSTANLILKGFASSCPVDLRQEFWGYISNINEPELLHSAIAGGFPAWLEQDPEAASLWTREMLVQQKNWDTSYDVACVEIVKHLLHHKDFEMAVAWASVIRDPARRAEELGNVEKASKL